MSDVEWTIERLDDKVGSEAVLDVVGKSLPGNEVTRKTDHYWQWKHLHNPFGVSTGTLGLGVVRGDVVGVRSFMRWALDNSSTGNGRQYRAARAVDAVTAEGWRGKGVFRRLTLAAIDALEHGEFDVVFNTPNQKSAPGNLKMGWQCVGDVPLYVRPLRPFRLALHVLQARLGGRAEGGAHLSALPRWESSSELMALVQSHERARAGAGLRTPRSAAYLSWRYGAHPQADYRVLVDGPASAPTGLAVLRANRRLGADELVLVELWARDARADYLASVLRRVLAVDGFDHVMAHFKVGSVEHAALRRALFFKLPQRKMRLFARALGRPLPADVFSFDGWDLSLGDLELF